MEKTIEEETLEHVRAIHEVVGDLPRIRDAVFGIPNVQPGLVQDVRKLTDFETSEHFGIRLGLAAIGSLLAVVVAAVIIPGLTAIVQRGIGQFP